MPALKVRFANATVARLAVGWAFARPQPQFFAPGEPRR
jgi:hypothetical protein